MRIVIQRVKEAAVHVEGECVGAIQKGYLLLVGIAASDTEATIQAAIRKIVRLRLFNDEQGKMNLSLQQIDGEILSVSQFTLYADTRKGNRPSFTQAALPEYATTMYEKFNDLLQEEVRKVATGKFGADMQVSLVNDGPVTITLEFE